MFIPLLSNFPPNLPYPSIPLEKIKTYLESARFLTC